MPSTTGDRLHQLIKDYTGEDLTPKCNCRKMIAEMNANPPQWSLANMQRILKVMRTEAARRKWWAKFALAIPGSSTPLRWMIREAVRLALLDEEAKDGAESS